MAAQPRSAAVQIVRPPTFVPRNPSSSDRDKDRRPGGIDTTQRLCRNVLIYGSCRFQGQGCVYYHPPSGAELERPGTPSSSSPALTNATPASKDSKTSEIGAEHLAAPVFVPKTPMTDDASPRSIPPTAQPSWPSLPGSEGLASQAEASSSSIQPNTSYDDSSFNVSHSQMDGSMYMHPPPMRQPLDYHLYTSPLPHIANPPLTSHPLHSFFIPDDLRLSIQSRHEAIYTSPSGPTGLPAELGVYHSLVSLGAPQSLPSRVYGHPAPVYRAVSSVDGNVYALRRIEGYKLVNEAAFGAIDTWRRTRHPNVVSLREAFTTKAFNDNSLILVYDFHPDATTIWEEHISIDQPVPSMGRRRLGMPIQERTLWSYITQIANALKAIHSSGLAARNLDPSKALITGKNRIRLNGCGIWDVLAYDPTTPIAVYQQEDLVSFGKLVISMACEFFAPGQHPAAPLDHIARYYSPDLKDVIMFLISKPQPNKTVDDVIRMLGPRLLNELDGMQNYVDVLESELGAEVENGRIVRLLSKLGFINERAEFELDPRWSDTGDRYILKLFRDYVFHSIGLDGNPVLDLSHVLTCLNKLDVGLDERIMLISRDDQSCLVVSYREIKSCVEAAFAELRNASNHTRILR